MKFSTGGPYSVPNFMRSNMDPNGANRSGMGKFRADRDLLGPIGAKKAD